MSSVLLAAAVIGCASINPDGGSYPQWEAEVAQMLERWRGSFGHCGLAMLLQRTRRVRIFLCKIALDTVFA